MRPITHLLYVLELSAMSKLLSACSKPFSTPLGSYPNVLKSLSQKNIKKSLFEQNFIHKRLGQNIFYIFLPKAIFDSWRCCPNGVMGWMKEAEDSSLSNDSCSQDISAAIEQHHLHKSIFRLLRNILQPIECSTPAKALEDVRHHYFWPPSATSGCLFEQLDKITFRVALGVQFSEALAKPVLCLQYSPMGDHIDKACACQHIPGSA